MAMAISFERDFLTRPRNFNGLLPAYKIDILRSICHISETKRMFSYTGGVVLFAAVLHASWNAMLHGNRDRFLSMTWMSIAIGVVSAFVVLYLPLPPKAAWPYIVASGLVHIV